MNNKIVTKYHVLLAGDIVFLRLNCLALRYLETVMNRIQNLNVACAIER